MSRLCRFAVLAAFVASEICLLAQPFRIAPALLAPQQQVALRFESDPSFYYLLHRGNTIHSISNVVAATMGTIGSGTFLEGLAAQTAFYRVERVPLSQVRDTDGDGITDLYELGHSSVLNAADPADADLDFDGDGLSNRFESQVGTDPERASLFFNGPAVVDCLGLNFIPSEVVIDGATVTLDCELFVQNFIIRNGGVLTHSAGQTNGLRLRVAHNLTVDAQSFISVEGKGYPAGAGPGGTSLVDGSGGAAHGGNGGAGQLGEGGLGYGSAIEPRTLGSGGSVPGGGAIHLQVGGVFRLDGKVNANGQSGSVSSSGSAGGSVFIETELFEGTGAVSAMGSNGGVSRHIGGGGGGGRVALVATTNRFQGTISACGGAGYVPGGAGTVLQRPAGADRGTLLVDNCSRRGASTVMTADQTFDSIRVRGGAVISPRAGQISCLTVPGDVFIEATGLIGADGQGHPSQSGPGSRPATAGQGGAGYGGLGGDGQAGAGGVGYGEIIAPMDLGSGAGAAGGGALCLVIGGVLQVDGQISANGLSDGASAGGGSGGSLFIRAANLSGAGAITANGGAGGAAAQLGGGGGGGRIAIYYSQRTFMGTISACGGAGGVPGGAGTIYWRDLASGQDRLIVDNCARVGASTVLFGTNRFDAFFVDHGGIVSPEIGATNFHLLVRGDATVESTGFISANGLGYAAGAGPGGAPSGDGSGGGGYGGEGGTGQTGNGGLTYGSELQPFDLGSGGSGPGGGALRITVLGTLRVNGQISSNGRSGGFVGGGGAGGSILITANALIGGGSILANGGNGGGSAKLGGGGGGGRIAIHSSTPPQLTDIHASGGPGAQAGQAGTVYFGGVEALNQIVEALNRGID